ncbi:MAG: iron-containing alcohol dehydrogenase [Eubacterium sp.]|nr:iron-containing alcohol dehydrogenase [Eubacterium sp.]
MNSFIYSYPTKQYFGKGAAKKAFDAELSKYGRKVMLACGGGSIKKSGIYNEIVHLLKGAEKEIIEFSGIMPNPTYAKVQEGARLVKENEVDFILAVGGGSVIDCCKIISSQACTEEDIWEMEFSKGRFPVSQIPMGALVTASGTGAEQNAGAVITNEEKNIKTGVFGAHYDFAVLDPEYTLSLPMKQVVSGAFDTLSHCMETYFGTGGEYNLSDDINEAVMKNVIRNIRAVVSDHNDISARGELMWASAMGENGILKIGKITDFQAHQIEHQLGAYTNCNHGQGLAVIQPVLYRHIYECNIKKFAQFAVNVWGIEKDSRSDTELAAAGIRALEDFIKEIGMPTSFSEMNIDKNTDLKAVADSSNITDGCCKKLTHEEILEILKECL